VSLAILAAAQTSQRLQVSEPDNTAVWLTLVGALLVALIAAGTAQWRLRVQLNHERQLHDLGELRAVLDEAAAMTWHAMNSLADAWQAADEWATPPAGDDPASSAATVKRCRHEAFEAIWPMEGMLGRLALRIGDHAVTRAFSDYHQAARSAARAVPLTRPSEPRNDIWRDEYATPLRDSRQAFVDGGKQLVGSQISGVSH
jgi:hypothetical protein